MEDRFKFRFWDTEDSQFIDWSTAVQSAFNRGECSLLHVLITSSRYEKQQCTGIKDKNGKLIFEGDVAKIKRADNCFGRDNFTEKVLVGRADWAELGNLPSGGPDGDYPVISIEIIGNIHENPELLEKQ